MVFGEAIFIGWAASTFLILGGVIASCISCSTKDECDDDYLRRRVEMYSQSHKIAKEYV